MEKKKVSEIRVNQVIEKEKIKIKKQKDGSITEFIGDKEKKFERTFLPFRFEIDNLSYIQSTTNPGGRVPLLTSKKEREERELTYEPIHSERLLGTGVLGGEYNSCISVLGSGYETNYLEISIIKFVLSPEEKLSGGEIIYFEHDDYTRFCVTLVIESLVFDKIKSLLLNNNLKSVDVGLDFSRNKRVYSGESVVYQDQWRILSSEKVEPHIEGVLESITLRSKSYSFKEQNGED